MNSLAKAEMRPFPVRNTLLVGGNPDIEALLEDILEPNAWAIQHTTDNATALLLAQKKGLRSYRDEREDLGKRGHRTSA